MRDIDFSGIDLGQIQTFLSVARYESFSKAAEVLHITQPVASKRVATLENRLGLVLFIRWKRTIRLTPAGRVLYEAWSNAINAFTEPLNKAKTSQYGYTSQLVVGYYGSTFYYQIGAAFQKKYPDTAINFVRLHPRDMGKALLTGQADFIFYGQFAEEAFSIPPLKCMTLATYPKELWCRQGSHFSGRERVSMDELKEERFVTLSPANHIAWTEQFESMCKRAEFIPKIAASVDDISSLPMNICEDNRVFIADGGYEINMSEFNFDRVKIINENSGTIIAWNSHYEKTEYFQFIDVSKKYFADKFKDWHT